MKKRLLAFVVIMTLVLSLAACGITPAVENETPADEPQGTETVEPSVENDVQTTPSETDEPQNDAPETSAPAAETGRQDGERYEGISMFQGMEQTVYYEHMVNTTAGFEMDYDYETFVRHSEADRERFVLAWDDAPENPEYYLEVTYSTEDAETVAAAIGEELSKDYEINRGSTELDRAGSCIRSGASEVKGGGYTADQMQMVYIIPADDGCRIATAHYGFDSSDFFSARFRAMVNTLSVIDMSPTT